MRRALAAAGLLAAALAGSPAAAVDDAAFGRCAGITEAAVRLACYDALATPPAPAPATPPAAPAPAPAPGDFGLPRNVSSEPQPRLTARIAGPLKEWKRGTLFRLDNGQVWKAVGDDSAYYPDIPDDAEVTIRQTLFGGYVLEIAAIRRKVKVKRVS